MRRITSAGAFLVLLCMVSPAQAEPVVRQIPFTRKVSMTVPGRYNFEFRLWTSSSPSDPAGEMVWLERKSIRLNTATLKHSLGSVTPFSNEGTGRPPVDFSQQLWVEVARLSGGSYTPLPGARTKLAARPYALHAETADIVAGTAKAAAYVYCAGNSSSIVRSVNNEGGTVTLVANSGMGECTIDVGFQVNDRYWSVSTDQDVFGAAPNACTASCVAVSGQPNQIECTRWNDRVDTFQAGNIMIVVF